MVALSWEPTPTNLPSLPKVYPSQRQALNNTPTKKEKGCGKEKKPIGDTPTLTFSACPPHLFCPSALSTLLPRGPLAVHILHRLEGARSSPKGPSWPQALLPPEPSSLARWCGVTWCHLSSWFDTKGCYAVTPLAERDRAAGGCRGRQVTWPARTTRTAWQRAAPQRGQRKSARRRVLRLPPTPTRGG